MELFNKILSLVTKSQNIKDKNDDWVIIGVVDNAEAQLIEKKNRSQCRRIQQDD